MLNLKNSIFNYLAINENRVVTFDNNKLYPSEGWCVIMLGGPGSGKGYFRKNKLPIDAKIIDVDELKEKFKKLGLAKDILNGEEYDSSNPKHVSALHMAVKQHGWKTKILNMFFNDVKQTGHLANILFDITGADPDHSVRDKILTVVKALGYKTCVIWVITQREQAMIRNLQRDRSVSDSILHGIHQNLAINLPAFLQNPDNAKYIDNLWLYFSSSIDISKTVSKEEDIQNLIKIPKIEGKYEFSKNINDKLCHYAVATAQSDYISSAELIHKYGIVSFDKNGKRKVKFDTSKMSNVDLKADDND